MRQRHFLEDALRKTPKALEKELDARLRAVSETRRDYKTYREGLAELVAHLEDQHPHITA